MPSTTLARLLVMGSLFFVWWPRTWAQTGGVAGSIVLGNSLPCRHCEIHIRGLGKEYSTMTDDEGNFLYVRLPAGSYFVEFTDAFTHEKTGVDTQVAAGSPGSVTINMSTIKFTQGSGEIQGTLRLDGRPCSACTVLIEPANTTYGTETDSKGDFRYHLPAGEWVVSMRLPDGRSFKSKLFRGYAVGPGQVAKADLDLTSVAGNCLTLTRHVAGANGDSTKLIEPGEGCPSNSRPEIQQELKPNIGASPN